MSEVIGVGVALAAPTSKYQITDTGLEIYGEITLEEWGEIGFELGKEARRLTWAIVDWLNKGEDLFGEDEMWQICEVTGLSQGRLDNLKSLGRGLPRELRTLELSISHHEAVRPLYEHPEAQRQLLEMALAYEWSRDEMRSVVAQVKAEAGMDAKQLTASANGQTPQASITDVYEQAIRVAKWFRLNRQQELHAALLKLSEMIHEKAPDRPTD